MTTMSSAAAPIPQKLPVEIFTLRLDGKKISKGVFEQFMHRSWIDHCLEDDATLACADLFDSCLNSLLGKHSFQVKGHEFIKDNIHILWFSNGQIFKDTLSIKDNLLRTRCILLKKNLASSLAFKGQLLDFLQVKKIDRESWKKVVLRMLDQDNKISTFHGKEEKCYEEALVCMKEMRRSRYSMAFMLDDQEISHKTSQPPYCYDSLNKPDKTFLFCPYDCFLSVYSRCICLYSEGYYPLLESK